MGINGILPILKPITRPRHVKEYRGRRCAIDAFSWLHKGAYGCARQLCEGHYTDKFVLYCMSKVEMLLSNGVEPVIVFDGGRLPMKADEEDGRRRSRRENLEKAQQHMMCGNVAAAEECFQRAVNITSSMAKQWIEALKERGVSFIVAPYEADAQMARLALSGDVWAVITEDSDLLAYGCPRVLFKMDKFGNGEEICIEDLPLNTGTSFQGFTHTMFVEMCVLAGCDFVESLPGIGAKKAHQHMRKLRSFVKVCKSLRFNGTQVPRGYEERVQRALWVFRHQRVFCPHAKQVVHLRPLPPGGLGAADVDVPSALPARNQQQGGEADGASDGAQEDELSFLGPMITPDIACGVAAGDLDPTTKQPYDLATIYRGAKRLPPQVAQALGSNHQALLQPQQRVAAHPGGGSQLLQVSQNQRHQAQQQQQQQQQQQHPWQAPTVPSSSHPAPGTSQPPPSKPPAFKVSGLRRTSGGRAAAGAAKHGAAAITHYFPQAAAPTKGNARSAFVPPRMAGSHAHAAAQGGSSQAGHSQQLGSTGSEAGETQQAAAQNGGSGAGEGEEHQEEGGAGGVVLSSPLAARRTPGKKMRVGSERSSPAAEAHATHNHGDGDPHAKPSGRLRAQALFPSNGDAAHAAVLGATNHHHHADLVPVRRCISQPPLADMTNQQADDAPLAQLLSAAEGAPQPELFDRCDQGPGDMGLGLHGLPPKSRASQWAAPRDLDPWGRPSGGRPSGGPLQRANSAPGPLSGAMGLQEEVQSEAAGSSGAAMGGGMGRHSSWYGGGRGSGSEADGVAHRRQPVSVLAALARPCHSSGGVPISSCSQVVSSQATSGTLPLESLAIPYPVSGKGEPSSQQAHTQSEQSDLLLPRQMQPPPRRVPAWAVAQPSQARSQIRPVSRVSHGPSPFFGGGGNKRGSQQGALFARDGDCQAAAGMGAGDATGLAAGLGSRLKQLLQPAPAPPTQVPARTAFSMRAAAVQEEEEEEEQAVKQLLRGNNTRSMAFDLDNQQQQQQPSIAQHLFGEFAMGPSRAATTGAGRMAGGSQTPGGHRKPTGHGTPGGHTAPGRTDGHRAHAAGEGRTPGSGLKSRACSLYRQAAQGDDEDAAGQDGMFDELQGGAGHAAPVPMEIEDLTRDTDEEAEEEGLGQQGRQQPAATTRFQGTQLIGEQLEVGALPDAAEEGQPAAQGFHSLAHIPAFAAIAESVIDGVAAAAVDAVAGGAMGQRTEAAPPGLSSFAFGGAHATPHGKHTRSQAAGKAATPGAGAAAAGGGRTPRNAARATPAVGRTPATAPSAKAHGLQVLRGGALTPAGKGIAGRSAGKGKGKAAAGRGGGTSCLVPQLFVALPAAETSAGRQNAPGTDADGGEEEEQAVMGEGTGAELHGMHAAAEWNVRASQKLRQPFRPPGTAANAAIQQGLARFAFGVGR